MDSITGKHPYASLHPALVTIFLGVAAFLLIVGPRALYPSNIAWLSSGDPAQHFLGWQFFRNSGWEFPAGLNPSNGLELSNAIVYSDSNPLMAFLFKPFSAFLPQVFQYFGIWLLTCFILQAWFGWKLVGLISQNFFVQLLGAGLLVLSPPMLWRLHGHFSLVGHFVILAALYLTLRPNNGKRLLWWSSILVVAALMHAYFLAMVGVLWIADISWRTFKREQLLKQSVVESIAIFLVVVLACWQAGYFTVISGLSSGGFGYYRMNLLSIIDSSSWSYFMPDIPEKKGDYEGFNYLGLGVIALAILSIPFILSGQSGIAAIASKRPLLIAVLIGFAVFSLSNNIGVGLTDFSYPINKNLEKFADIFRSSGRIFWPVYYAIVLLLICVAARSFGKRMLVPALAMALALQVIDTSAGWLPIRQNLMATPAPTWNTPLQDPFWDEAAKFYKKVRVILPRNHSDHWKTFSYYASMHGLATDAVYLARIDNRAMEKAQSNAQRLLSSAMMDQDALYIIEEKFLHQVASKINKDTDLLAKIDGIYVLAPGWKQCRACTLHKGELQPINIE